jgi:hypothetical protein
LCTVSACSLGTPSWRLDLATFHEALCSCKTRACHHFRKWYRLSTCVITHFWALMQLDALLFELFALSYLLDPVIPRLLFRATAQFQFARPRDLDRSLRFMFIYCSLVNVGPVLRHVLSSFHYETQGLLLDFIGRCEPSIPR